MKQELTKLRSAFAHRAESPSRTWLAALLGRKRFQLISTGALAAIAPWFIRGAFLPGNLFEPAAVDTLIANVMAVLVAFWMRLSIESYPGIRRAYVILTSASVAHALAWAWFMMSREPYNRVGMVSGFILHVFWLYAIFATVELRRRRRIAVVPYGRIQSLEKIANVDWLVLSRPFLRDARACQAIVADFNCDLPDDWEKFLANAALDGRIVYQVKQLSESLTGRVELEHLSENSFGSLVPARGYFYLKSAVDWVASLLLLPLLLPALALVALAIRLEAGGPAIFRQTRVGHAGRNFTLYKFRTMREVSHDDDRAAAMTVADDKRITAVGRFLRRTRLDELPQIFNILKGEMSWIGPRPEAEVLSHWYQSEIPFYPYRHVVKPGISGWAQVNQGHVADVEQVHRKLQYDFYYVKYFSPALDLLILVRTLKTMLSGFGAK